ncbi:MAG TPA: hypothetical protein VJO33_02000, partial [Gemmatimonadaceae bacterium]|nr:hypothetical protein [Gemmatimonadaceae bacterium]
TATHILDVKALALKDLASVLGHPCWQVRWDNQVGLDMNFGAPKMEIHEPRVSDARSERVRATFARRRVSLRGTHWLVIAPFTWTIRLADGLRASASSSAKRQEVVCHRLGGEKLEAIRIDPRSGRTQFYFDLGAQIIVRGERASPFGEYDLWSLHARARGRFVAIHGGGGYRSGSLRGTGDGTHPILARDGEGSIVVGKPPERST